MNKKTIFYIGNFTFPNSSASSHLVLGNGKALRSLGYDVVFVGNSTAISIDSELNNTKIEYDEFIGYHIPQSKSLKGLKNYRKFSSQIMNLLESKKNDTFAVICYGSPSYSFFLNKLYRWCKKSDIQFIANCVDISALSHGTLAERILKWLDNQYKRVIFKYKTDGIIAVSKYIESYFNLDNKKTVIIPPLVDSSKLPDSLPKLRGKREIVYAGVPFPYDGRKVDVTSYKDRLDIAIEILSEVYKVNKNFNFNIYGITKEQYLGVIKKHEGLLEKLSDVVIFHGPRTHDEIKGLVSRADFTINLRDINQMTSAGFSTKFVESLSCGTPTITTNTSDLDSYLVEGKNGFFIDINNRPKAVSKLIQILEMDRDQISRMKKYCKDSNLFDYRNYSELMNVFINELKSGV